MEKNLQVLTALMACINSRNAYSKENVLVFIWVTGYYWKTDLENRIYLLGVHYGLRNDLFIKLNKLIIEWSNLKVFYKAAKEAVFQVIKC